MKRKVKKPYSWIVISLILTLLLSYGIWMIGEVYEKSLLEWYQFESIIVRQRHYDYAVMEALANESASLQKENDKMKNSKRPF